jgi:hypothetical protein
LNPKYGEAPPFAERDRESHSPERPSTSWREKRREIVPEKDRSTRKKHPQVEEKEDIVESVTMINGAIPSTLMW